MKGSIELRSKLNKNKVGSWRIEISTGRRKPDGSYERIRELFRGTKEQAELRKAELLLQLNRNEYIPDNNMAFGDLAEKWMEEDVRVNLEPNTYRFYKDMLEQHIVSEIKDVPISKITSATVKTLMAKMQKKTSRKGEPLSPTTIRHVRATLSACLQYAVDELEILRENPCTSTRSKRRRRGNTQQSQVQKIKSSDVYDEEQVRDFLAAAKEEWYFMYFLIAASTGMRQNEILALTWDNVDFKRRVIRVEKAIKQNDKDGVIVGGPKTPSSVRSIVMDEVLTRALKFHRVRQNEQKLLMGPAYEDQNLVIANEVGRIANAGQLRKVMKRIAEKGKVPYIPPKNLRHTHATLLLRAGVHPKIVQERLGHSSVLITLNVYSVVLETMQEEATERFESLLYADVSSPDALETVMTSVLKGAEL